NITLPWVVIQGNSAVSWNTTRRSSPGPDTGLPSMVIAPSVGRSKPASSRISVLLPQPDGPIITVSLPRGTVNEQSRTTVLANFPAPYTFVTWLASIWAKVPATGCPIGAGGAGSRVSIPVLLLLAQPWRHHFAELAQECARHVAGDADADHSDDDLVVGA